MSVTAALRCRPDLIIVDAQLWEGNGASAVDEILGTGFVPHLFVSGDIKKVVTLKRSWRGGGVQWRLRSRLTNQNSSRLFNAHLMPRMRITEVRRRSYRMGDCKFCASEMFRSPNGSKRYCALLVVALRPSRFAASLSIVVPHAKLEVW
jgi:hypothetical protein